MVLLTSDASRESFKPFTRDHTLASILRWSFSNEYPVHWSAGPVVGLASLGTDMTIKVHLHNKYDKRSTHLGEIFIYSSTNEN